MRGQTTSTVAKSEERTINYDITSISEETLKKLYYYMLFSREIENRMIILLRQGKISKWFSGIGQEAISTGAALAQKINEYFLTLIRNLPVFLIKGVPLDKLFLQIQGKEGGFTKARDRSFHFGTKEHHIVGMISHLGPQLSVACGIALAHKLNKEEKAVIVVTGDGATSEGEFHEALNLASVWELPVLFIIENNQWAISTPIKEQYRIDKLSQRALAYGMEGKTIDGNNVIEVYKTTKEILEKMRKKPFPYLLECITFRRRGHEEASGTKYVPKEMMEYWEKRDPLLNYQLFLLEKKILTPQEIDEMKKEITKKIQEALNIAFNAPPPIPNPQKELEDIYFPYVQDKKVIIQKVNEHQVNLRKMRYVDAIREALIVAMKKYPNLIIMGQDIAEYGGVFKVTEGLYQMYGKERVRNVPLCEEAIVGCALGLSIQNFKAIVEMQYSDFASNAMTQIINNVAKIHYRWGQNADIVIRMPTGAGIAAGPFHSQSLEALFFHIPGLKIVYPATPFDAKGLLLAAISDPNPYLFFEHKALYRSITDNVPEDYYEIEIGKANILREGQDLTIITYGMGVHWALDVLNKHPEISATLIDLRTLCPLDKQTIFDCVKATGKVLILHEDTLTGGIGAEIAALISENCFEYLDAPILRCASLDTPVPFAPELERSFLASDRLEKTILELWRY